ncbi:MAG: zf-TFIIB domain-containing protein [Phycisphaerae bacterium]|nr:zf-TFIIB domain-containing protein [Phycisphaerae bacterium]NUQ48156.1 zf-TFIIB domain-containing protein [Phycisphaerae bacterium]
MHCPRCTNVALNEAPAGPVSVDRCPKCHGLWLDELELEALLSARPRTLLADDRAVTTAAPAEDARINCPRCRNVYLIKLNSRARPGTIIDSCTVCFGAWLDAGELSRLAHADLAGRLREFFGLK